MMGDKDWTRTDGRQGMVISLHPQHRQHHYLFFGVHFDRYSSLLGAKKTFNICFSAVCPQHAKPRRSWESSTKAVAQRPDLGEETFETLSTKSFKARDVHVSRSKPCFQHDLAVAWPLRRIARPPLRRG